MVIGALSLSAGAATFYAEMTNDDFTPQHLYVPVGTTVNWKNFGTHTHDVVSTTGLFNSGPITTGGSFSYTFNTVGNYDYICTYHDSIAVPMTGMVHVRTTAQLTLLLTMTPGSGFPIAPSGGTFTYTPAGTNQTSSVMMTTFWTKMYYPNNTFLQTFLKGVQIPAMGSRSALLSQSVPGSAPAGAYIYQGNLGTNTDSVLAWASFTFTKSALDGLEGTGWEVTVLEDWHDVTNPYVSVPAATLPEESKLSLSNSPEPFNPSTVINFNLPENGAAQLDIFNISGSKIATLVNGYRQAGAHQVTFDASNLPSGMYLYRLSFGGESVVNKMMLVK
jgi:plastocyanin